MPTLMKFILSLHRELKLKLENYPTHVRETALSLDMVTFGKTRFCNHLSIVSSCLRYKVISITLARLFYRRQIFSFRLNIENRIIF